jgi:hypothetical protein
MKWVPHPRHVFVFVARVGSRNHTKFLRLALSFLFSGFGSSVKASLVFLHLIIAAKAIAFEMLPGSQVAVNSREKTMLSNRALAL